MRWVSPIVAVQFGRRWHFSTNCAVQDHGRSWGHSERGVGSDRNRNVICSRDDRPIVRAFRCKTDAARLINSLPIGAETTAIAAQVAAGSRANLAKTEIWLPGPVCQK